VKSRPARRFALSTFVVTSATAVVLGLVTPAHADPSPSAGPSTTPTVQPSDPGSPSSVPGSPTSVPGSPTESPADPGSPWPSWTPSVSPSPSDPVSPTPSSSPSDATTGSISGVFLANGQGIADVSVQVYGSGYNYVGYAYTDWTGAFTVNDLAPGTYKLDFYGYGGEQWYDGQPDWAHATPVVVVAGQQTAVVEHALPTGTITGTLTDSSGAPVAYANVYAQSDTGGSDYATADAAGHYSLDLQPGTYRITFYPPNLPYEYAHDALSYASAATFAVVAGQSLQVDEQLPATGSITGRYTAPDGSPIAGASVQAVAGGDGSSAYATTANDGTYTISPVYVGQYAVGFFANGSGQWAHGQLDEQKAQLFTVTAGAATEVDDTALGTGSVIVVATDAATGKAVMNFCADADNQYGCTTTGTLTLTGVRQGTQRLDVFSPDTHHFSLYNVPVTVTAGQSVAYAAKLPPGATIDVVVKDHTTGQPLAGICVAGFTATDAIMPDGFGDCTDDQGVMKIGPLADGPFTLYATDHSGSGYGDQWVGANGGVGRQELAQKVYVGVGKEVTGPTILMDRAGRISGTVTDASGAPVSYATVTTISGDAGSGGGGPAGITDSQGHYEFGGLGPYAWPLEVSAANVATQWTGGVANRRNATSPVTVVSGGTVTEDIALESGIVLSGKVRGADGTAATPGGRLVFYNKTTGDIVAIDDLGSDGSYRVLLLSPQNVKIQLYAGTPDSLGGWYGGTDFDSATVVAITGHHAIVKDLVFG
jgi:Carboxypeptidase regulatory-like domain